MPIVKPYIYDTFFCIADQCSFSCCCNWNITIDDETMKKYQEDSDILAGIDPETKKMRIDDRGWCYFLDDKGLCMLVTRYGENFVCDTCARFPRQILERQGIQEHSLSNA